MKELESRFAGLVCAGPGRVLSLGQYCLHDIIIHMGVYIVNIRPGDQSIEFE